MRLQTLINRTHTKRDRQQLASWQLLACCKVTCRSFHSASLVHSRSEMTSLPLMLTALSPSKLCNSPENYNAFQYLRLHVNAIAQIALMMRLLCVVAIISRLCSTISD